MHAADCAVLCFELYLTRFEPVGTRKLQFGNFQPVAQAKPVVRWLLPSLILNRPRFVRPNAKCHSGSCPAI